MGKRAVEGCPEAALTPISPTRGDPRSDQQLAPTSPDGTQSGIVSGTPDRGRQQDATFSLPEIVNRRGHSYRIAQALPGLELLRFCSGNL